MSSKKIILMAGGVFLASSLAWAGGDLPTKFSNQGSIANTRHNLTQRQTTGGPDGQIMDAYRNDYQDVCVYCHTPESTSTPGAPPVWNRTMRPTAYATYNLLGTSSLTQLVAQPGINSLMCLSCHDGQTAVDSIIYMPGTDRFQLSQATTQDNTFLDTWKNETGPNPHGHRALSSVGCLVCHSPDGPLPEGAPDFTAAALSTDLRNDHPVGVVYPATFGSVPDFNRPLGVSGSTFFFDTNRDGLADRDEVRLYDSSGLFTVECGSCHDPHGVPSGAAGSVFKPTFLRVANAGSGLCLTCHNK